MGHHTRVRAAMIHPSRKVTGSS